jgi:antitoxin CptB
MQTLPARLRWACRRGMLELDLLLLPFFEKVFVTLDEKEQQLFERLLSCSDQELFNWLVRHQQPSEPEFILLIERIRSGA